MGRDPAFLFYFRDFLVSTELMTAEEVGLYIRILCHMADKGRLSKEHMQSICKAYGIAPALHNKFKIDEKGLFYNPRLEEEVIKRCNYTQSRRENAKHMHKHMGNANANDIKERIVKENYPTKEEILVYKNEINGNIEPHRFIDFYESKGWMIGKNRMKSWKAAYRRACAEWDKGKPNTPELMKGF
ncbi:MAG: hypothetical protein AABY22_23930 [Nanoarchaeota archaeon]